MQLSIVTTMYCSAKYLHEFYTRTKKEAEKITQHYEIVFVNDGSPDNSLAVATSLHEIDRQHVKVVDLSRNFGHHKAIMAGLSQAKGELVMLIDCDLEEEPEILSTFFEQLNQDNVDVVYGIRQRRTDNFLKKTLSRIFWRVFQSLSNCSIPRNQFTARLMTQRYVKSLVAHQEQEIFLPGLFAITGYKQKPCVIEKHFNGDSTYTFKKRMSQAVNSITSFSNKPLIYIFYLGSSIVFASGIAAAFLVLKEIIYHSGVAGWPSLIVSVWLLGGLTIFCLGLIGIYLSKVFVETKQRPHTIIRNIYETSQEQTQEQVSFNDTEATTS